MINFVGKSLVMLHTMLSLMGMAWALMIIFQSRDLGYASPNMDVLETTQDGAPKKAIVYASEYDRSLAALTDAGRTRDRVYAQVQPAIDSVRSAEPFLSDNHLFYVAQKKRLMESKTPIEVRRLKNGGLTLEAPLGKPIPEQNVVALTFHDASTDMKGNIEVKDRTEFLTKSLEMYAEDLKVLLGHIDPKTKKVTKGKIDLIEEEIQGIVERTQEYTYQLTGKNKLDEYEQPGLYKLFDLEFDAQTRIKKEQDDIKPYWSQAIEKARLLRYRKLDLEAQRDKLLEGLPAHLKKNKK
jgi:hypothetical protein